MLDEFRHHTVADIGIDLSSSLRHRYSDVMHITEAEEMLIKYHMNVSGTLWL